MKKEAAMSGTLKPFADDAASLGIGGLTIENGTDSIAIYGQTDLTRDRAGLEQARTLSKLLNDIVKVLEIGDLLSASRRPRDRRDREPVRTGPGRVMGENADWQANATAWASYCHVNDCLATT